MAAKVPSAPADNSRATAGQRPLRDGLGDAWAIDARDDVVADGDGRRAPRWEGPWEREIDAIRRPPRRAP